MTTHVGDEAGVELSIAASEGTWRMSMLGSKGAKNPCLRRDFPVTVEARSATELFVDINGASVLKGCITTSGVLTSADGNTLEGALKDGRKVKLNRK